MAHSQATVVMETETETPLENRRPVFDWVDYVLFYFPLPEDILRRDGEEREGGSIDVRENIYWLHVCSPTRTRPTT